MQLASSGTNVLSVSISMERGAGVKRRREEAEEGRESEHAVDWEVGCLGLGKARVTNVNVGVACLV